MTGVPDTSPSIPWLDDWDAALAAARAARTPVLIDVFKDP